MPIFDFDPRFIEIGYERMIIDQYVEMIEAHLPAIKERERERIWGGVDASDDAELQAANHLEDRLDEGVTTRFLVAASIVACWALYESAVQELADYIRNRRGIALRMALIRGDFLERAKTYFADVLGLPLHDEADDWQRLTELARLRHFLAHANGDLRNIPASARPGLVARLSQTSGLTVVDDRYLVIDPQFASDVLLFLKGLLDELIERVRAATR